jgi:hypothetical protein
VKWDVWLLAIATGGFFVASLISTVGGPWNTYGHHTALTGFAETAFCGAFLVAAIQKQKK